jgi:hypothetical protein
MLIIVVNERVAFSACQGFRPEKKPAKRASPAFSSENE